MNKKSEYSILGLNPGHDGAIAYIVNGELKFSIESEKDNGYRYSEINTKTFIKSMELCENIPDVIASGGWSENSPTGKAIDSGYFGLSPGLKRKTKIFGKHIDYFSSSHERSHIFGAYGMSPFKQGQACYVLVWEGYLGRFYYIDEELNIELKKDIMVAPGVRYAFLYALADPSFKMGSGSIRLSDAGKLMALSAFASKDYQDEPGAKELVATLLSKDTNPELLNKLDYSTSTFYNCGVDTQKFSNIAKVMSENIFEYFYQEISKVITKKIPLLISGGCGLNCDWNSKWMDLNLFSDIFIPPCTNDSGSAIGSAVDAMYQYTGNAKLKWSVYAGELPVEDIDNHPKFEKTLYCPLTVANHLRDGDVIGWVDGRYEIGPRALGARSMLASPANPKMLDKLNKIKKREGFRPIAPICLNDRVQEYFFPDGESKYMLEFRKVLSKNIPAVTHVDNSARPQTIGAEDNPKLYELIHSFSELTSIAVLCNTSLNYNGRGFINRLSDMFSLALDSGLDGFVFKGFFYKRL